MRRKVCRLLVTVVRLTRRFRWLVINIGQSRWFFYSSTFGTLPHQRYRSVHLGSLSQFDVSQEEWHQIWEVSWLEDQDIFAV
jgi:hypothetical protein